MYWFDKFWCDFRKDQEMYLGVLELADMIEEVPRMKPKATALRVMFTRKVRFAMIPCHKAISPYFLERRSSRR